MSPILVLAVLLGCPAGGETDTDVDTDTSGDTDTDTTADDACEGNPLVDSCLDAWLEACWAPDMTGECVDTGTAVTWSDGHRIERTGAGAGFYGPDDVDPCVSFSYDGTTGTVTYEMGADTITDVNDGGVHSVTCPDGTSFQYTDAEGLAFNQCRGVMCPE